MEINKFSSADQAQHQEEKHSPVDENQPSAIPSSGLSKTSEVSAAPPRIWIQHYDKYGVRPGFYYHESFAHSVTYVRDDINEALYSALEAIERQSHKGAVVHARLLRCVGCMARAALSLVNSEKGNKENNQEILK